MEILELYATVCVSEIEHSAAWYARLIGREPDDRPMDGLVQWRGPAGGGLQLFRDTARAGSGLVTVITPDMTKTRKQLTAANIVLGPDLQGDYAIIAQVNDPDGNVITLTEPPIGL